MSACRMVPGDTNDYVMTDEDIDAIELASPSSRPNAANGWDEANTIVGYTNGESGHSTDDQYRIHVTPPEKEWGNDEFRKTVE